MEETRADPPHTPFTMETYEHPYGLITYNQWMPAWIHRYKKKEAVHDVRQADGYEIMFTNDDKGCIIRRGPFVLDTNKKESDNLVSLLVNNKAESCMVTHVMLMSAFPTQEPLETTDHIDNIATHNNIANLQWLSHSENSGKVAQFKDKKPPFSISIPANEVWRPLEYDDGATQVSCYGRVRRASGIVTIGTKLRANKSRSVLLSITSGEGKSSCTRLQQFYINRLVWEAWHGAIPPNARICHKLSAPLLPDGSHRNWLQDLVLSAHDVPEDVDMDVPTDVPTDVPMIEMTVEHRPRVAVNGAPPMPTGFWIQKETALKGAVVIVDIKRAVKNNKHLYWKSPSPKHLSMSYKVEVAKAFVRWVLSRHPDVAHFCDVAGCIKNKTGMTPAELELYNAFYFRGDQDDPFIETTEKGRKRTITRLPPDCGVTESMLPRYCTYRLETITRGDRFSIENHPKQDGARRCWNTTESRAFTTLQKYDFMMIQMARLNALE